jgi:hypothetical protein
MQNSMRRQMDTRKNALTSTRTQNVDTHTHTQKAQQRQLSFLTFAASLLGRIVRVRVLIYPLGGVVDADHHNLPHLLRHDQVVERVLALPRDARKRRRRIEQILPVVHDQCLVCLVGVFEVGGRQVDDEVAVVPEVRREEVPGGRREIRRVACIQTREWAVEVLR